MIMDFYALSLQRVGLLRLRLKSSVVIQSMKFHCEWLCYCHLDCVYQIILNSREKFIIHTAFVAWVVASQPQRKLFLQF